MHIMETFVDFSKLPLVRDVLVNLQISQLILLDEARDLRAALHTTERRATPCAAGYQLESGSDVSRPPSSRAVDLRSGGNFLTRSSDTNDGADTPALVASLEGSTHDVDLKDGQDGTAGREP